MRRERTFTEFSVSTSPSSVSTGVGSGDVLQLREGVGSSRRGDDTSVREPLVGRERLIEGDGSLEVLNDFFLCKSKLRQQSQESARDENERLTYPEP